MSTRKVILFSLILPVLYSAIGLKGTSGHDMSEKAIWIFFGFSFWAAGLLAGLFLAVIFRKPKAEPWFYLACQLILPLTMTGYIIVSNIEQAKHDRDFANMDENHFLVDLRNPDLSPHLQHLRTAFVKLESSFSDPNCFLLMKYRSFWRDTVIGNNPDTVYSVYFTYLMERKVRFAKIMVLGDSAVIDSLEMPAGPARFYPGRHFVVQGGSLAGLNELKKILQDEPAWVRDTVISILSQK